MIIESEDVIDGKRSIEELDRRIKQLETQMRGLMGAEHDVDGTHGDVTAESLDLQGGAVGEFVDIAHDTARYSVSSGTGVWTVSSGDQSYLRFSRIGQLVFLQFTLQTTALATAVAPYLVINMPELHAIPGLTSAASPVHQSGGIGTWNDVTNGLAGLMNVSALATNFTGTVTTGIYLRRHGSATSTTVFTDWAVTTELWVSGAVMFAVTPDNELTAFYGV